tara:strand:+ start:759 stop:917 length:159 start_codon:yes stop_codon:yes gene_type:complete
MERESLGKRQAYINEAEGWRQKVILEAEAEKMKRVLEVKNMLLRNRFMSTQH